MNEKLGTLVKTKDSFQFD